MGRCWVRTSRTRKSKEKLAVAAEIGDTVRLPAQLAERWGKIKGNSVQ
jgi:hypothetical protein